MAIPNILGLTIILLAPDDDESTEFATLALLFFACCLAAPVTAMIGLHFLLRRPLPQRTLIIAIYGIMLGIVPLPLLILIGKAARLLPG